MVEGKKRKQFSRGGQILVVRQPLFIRLGVFGVFRHVLAIEMFDHVDVERDASSISMARPLRILQGVNLLVPV